MTASYRSEKKRTDPEFVQKERKRSAARKRKDRLDPAIRARDAAITSEYLRNRRLTDPEFRARDNERRRADYQKSRNESANDLLVMLNRGELAAMGEPCFIYLFYDLSHTLLYVGITNDPKRRLYQHARDKSWFDQIETVKMAAFRSESEATAAESFLVKSLWPVHNIRLHAGRFVGTDHASALLDLMLRLASVELLPRTDHAHA